MIIREVSSNKEFIGKLALSQKITETMVVTFLKILALPLQVIKSHHGVCNIYLVSICLISYVSTN